MTKKSNDCPLSEQEMLEVETALIWGSEEKRPEHVSGMAISGGGIRAAVVALGVLQSLSEHGLLAKFSYISTVSGGGYIASALSWFWSRRRIQEERLPLDQSEFGCGKSDFPFRDAERAGPIDRSVAYSELSLQEKAVRNLDFLRHHGSYLTSGDRIGFAAMIIAVVRTVLLSLFVWVPLLVGIFWTIGILNRAIGSQLTAACANLDSIWCSYLGYLKDYPIYVLSLYVGIALVLFFCLSVITLALFTPALKEDTPTKMRRRVRQSVPYLAGGIATTGGAIWYFTTWYLQPLPGALAAVSILFAAWLFVTGLAKLSVANPSYFLRRNFDKCSHAYLPGTIVLLFWGSIPFIYHQLLSNFSAEPRVLGSVITLASGVSTALYGYYIKAKSILPGYAAQILSVGTSLLFLSGLFMCSFALAQGVNGVVGIFSATVILSLFVIALFLGMFSSVNATGLHRFYRDRLMETFMPMAESIASGLAKRSDVADTLSVADIWDRAPDAKSRPYHLINAHAILVRDQDPKVALRGGENFVLSAAVVGSTATGWLKTKDYVQANGPLTLASAMAVSGAAANANAGYIGTGVTRERFVSAVMAILNIRLGLWVANPRAIAARKRTKRFPMIAAYFGTALTSGICGFGNNRDSKFIELSDGGHFENLGLYELMRRKTSLILVVDAEQDEAINLSSLVSSANRVKEDFGATINFLEHRGPELLLGQESKQYPGGVKIAKSPFIVGQIRYNDEKKTRGVLIYIKATMIGGLEFATDGYRASNPQFPHQPTADQFFDPEQFEAYRDLGRKSCDMAVRELGLRGNPTPDEILKEYGFERKLC